MPALLGQDDTSDRFGIGAVEDVDGLILARDGALQGVNVDATAALARATEVPVIASGGVAALGDIKALQAEASYGIQGAIIGRALYDGRIDPAAALALVDANEGADAPC